ncbi:MAG: hypothetical protein NVSMB66_3040 [Candidatus Doudnabacteria bacterium]
MFYILEILFASAPLYIVRFKFGIPLNLLEIIALIFLAIFAFWLYKNNLVNDFIQHVEGQPRVMLILATLFLLAGLLAAFISPDKARGAGLWLALFLEPILIYLPANYILSSPLNKIRLVKFIFILIGLFSIFAIFQYFTLLGLPNAWLGNSIEPKRALSVFDHPNGFALFLTPLLAFLLPFVFERKLSLIYKFLYIISIFGLLLSLSRGGWLGFLLAAGVYVLFFASSRIQKTSVIAAIILFSIVYSVPNLRYRVILAYNGDRSTESRYSLWQTAEKMIKDSPILGKGLQGFKLNFDKYNTDPAQPSINLAHNIFLNFWVETGLAGLILFILISFFALFRAWRLQGLVSIGITLFLVSIYAHGLVDNPYLKNDLALVFWMILAFQS